MIECNADGYANAFQRGTYNNPLNHGEVAPTGIEGRYVYLRTEGGEVLKSPNPNY